MLSYDYSSVSNEANGGFGKYLGETNARNQEVGTQLATAGLDSYSKLLQAKEMAKAYKAQAGASSGGIGGILGGIGGILGGAAKIGSLFTPAGPAAAAAGTLMSGTVPSLGNFG
jgi:hypothetical protein